MKKSFFVRAVWDEEAKRFYSESDISGLAIETDTVEEFEEVLKDVAAELVLANHYTAEEVAAMPLNELTPVILWERPQSKAA